MQTQGWVTALLLLVAACDKDATPTEPPKTAPAVEAPAEPFPPAALRRDLRACEAEAPSVLAEIEYGVRVRPDGTVATAKALRTSAPPALLNCTLQRLRRWAFPQSTAGAAFRFTVRFGNADDTTTVSPSKRALKATIKNRTSALQHCYNAALRDDSNQTGQVDYVIVIAPTGEVTNVEARIGPNARLSAAFVECTKGKIERWTFPSDDAEAETRVSFPVVFAG